MTLKFVGDIANLQQSVKGIEKSVDGFGANAKRIGGGIVAALGTAAVIDFGKQMVTAASDAQQAAGAASSVFGQYTTDIAKFAKTTADQLGISSADFQQSAALTGSLLKAQGVPMQDLAGTTIDLTKRAADLAATFGGTVPDALAAINSALKGEFDPLESFGVSLKASTIDAKAQAMGLVDAEGKATSYGKAMAAQALIMEQSADKAGTFARESDTLAGQQARLGAQWKDMQAQLGTALLPVITELTTALRPLIEFVSKNADWLVPVALAIGAIVLAVKAWSAAQVILNIALTANPLGLIVLAIAAVVAAIVVLVKNWDAVVEAVKTATRAIVDAWEWVVDSLRYLAGLVFDIITYPYRRAWELLKYIAEQVTDKWRGVVDSLKYVFGGLADAITYPFRVAFDTIKWLWNHTVGGFGFTTPSWLGPLGGKEFRIPKMAQGGIVTRPTLVLAGEAGAEAIVPLGRGGGLGAVTINVYALNANSETGRLVADALREYQRTSGVAIGAVG